MQPGLLLRKLCRLAIALGREFKFEKIEQERVLDRLSE